MNTSCDADWRGARVTIMGLGLFGGGLAATRFAVEKGADVTVTDLRPAEKLRESIEKLEGLPIRYVLGEHDEADFTGSGLVIASPAVKLDSPYLVAADEAGVELTTEVVLFAQRFPGPVIAVSGSNGKTTTTALIGAILTAHDPRAVTGGNIGRPLLEIVDEIPADAPVALEVSSFQLEWLGRIGWSPDIGVLTNIAPNHLDWHGTMDAYVAAKRKLLTNQSPDQIAILNAGDSTLSAMADDLSGRVLRFSGAESHPPGSWIDGDRVMTNAGGSECAVMDISDIPLVGLHNRENVLAAVAATSAFGVPVETIAEAVRSFEPVEHRLELVRERDGVSYYNDSIATTPESTICALRSFTDGTVMLIAGGYDKGIEFDALGREIAQRAHYLMVLGVTADKITQAAISAGFPSDRIQAFDQLDEAVRAGSLLARSGDAIVMSPACASYDQYRNFAERGEHFRTIVDAFAHDG